MKKELDKELYPDSAETGIEKDYQKRSGVLGTCRRAYR